MREGIIRLCRKRRSEYIMFEEDLIRSYLNYPQEEDFKLNGDFLKDSHL